MRNLKLEGGRINVFDNYSEFVHQSVKGESGMTVQERSSRGGEDKKWAGGLTWEEVAALAPHGDLNMAQSLRKGLIARANQIMGHVQRMDPAYKSDGGIWIDISRYLSGEPECWGDMVYQGEQRNARRVAIVFNAGANSHVSAKDYERAALQIGASIVGLKASGVSVSLHVTYCNSAWGGDHDVTAINMTPGDGFDMAKLAAVCQTWFFRRVVFSYWETRDAAFRRAHGITRGEGYGRSEVISQANAERVTGMKGCLVLNIGEMASWDDERIKSTILDVLKGTPSEVKS